MSSTPLYIALSRPARFSPSGALARVTDTDAIAASVSELLTTLPGERPMRPEWGSLCRTRRFDPNDEHLAQDLIADTKDAIARWERRVAFVSAKVERGGVGGRSITVVVTFRERATGQISTARATMG